MSSTDRSKARYRRAACVLPPTALDAGQRRALLALVAARRCTIADLLRALLTEAASALPNPVDEAGTRQDAGLIRGA